MSKTQEVKTKFRSTKTWKDFRKQLKEEQVLDPLSQRKLTPRCHCHHRDLDEKNYSNLSDKTHFVMYNNYTHKTIHYLFNIAKVRGLKSLLKDLEKELELMLIINNKEEMIKK